MEPYGISFLFSAVYAALVALCALCSVALLEHLQCVFFGCRIAREMMKKMIGCPTLKNLNDHEINTFDIDG